MKKESALLFTTTSIILLLALIAVGLTGSSPAQAFNSLAVNECKLDKHGNGNRQCQCEALQRHSMPKDVLLHLSSLNVCNAVQTGQGNASPPSSNRPPSDGNCNDNSESQGNRGVRSRD